MVKLMLFFDKAIIVVRQIVFLLHQFLIRVGPPFRSVLCSDRTSPKSSKISFTSMSPPSDIPRQTRNHY